MRLTPAILTDSFLQLQQQVDMVKLSPLIEDIHVDIIDGSFVDNITVTPIDLTVGDFAPLRIDFHLMTEEPMDFVYECEGVKDFLPIRRIIGQVERMSHQADFIQEVKQNNWEPVLALDLFTPLEAIDEQVWPELRNVLLMGVEAGFQEQPLHPHVFEKIRQLREFLPDPQRLSISLDGGVKLGTLPQILQSGVDHVLVGSALWRSTDPLMTIEEFFRVAGSQ